MLKKLGFQALFVLGLIAISVLLLSKLTSITAVSLTVKTFFSKSAYFFLVARVCLITTFFFIWPSLIKKIMQKNQEGFTHYNEILELRWFILLIFTFIELLNYWR